MWPKCLNHMRGHIRFVHGRHAVDRILIKVRVHSGHLETSELCSCCPGLHVTGVDQIKCNINRVHVGTLIMPLIFRKFRITKKRFSIRNESVECCRKLRASRGLQTAASNNGVFRISKRGGKFLLATSAHTRGVGANQVFQIFPIFCQSLQYSLIIVFIHHEGN